MSSNNLSLNILSHLYRGANMPVSHKTFSCLIDDIVSAYRFLSIDLYCGKVSPKFEVLTRWFAWMLASSFSVTGTPKL